MISGLALMATAAVFLALGAGVGFVVGFTTGETVGLGRTSRRGSPP